MILSWQDRSSNEAAFQIERSQDALLFVPIATVGANITTYVDRSLDSATVYFYRVRAINAVGQSAVSNLAMDQTHPQSQFIRAGESMTFHAGLEGAPPVGYQWRFMDDVLPGATNETLTLPAADLTDAGEYSVLVTDGNGSARLSNRAVLVVVSPPRIVSQPDDYTRGVGMSVDFAVGIEGTAPFTYHWRMNGAPIGPSAPVLTLSHLRLPDQGGYDVLVENAFGCVTSRVATLRVYVLPGVVAPVPDISAEVLRLVRFTNVAIDPTSRPLICVMRSVPARQPMLTSTRSPVCFVDAESLAGAWNKRHYGKRLRHRQHLPERFHQLYGTRKPLRRIDARLAHHAREYKWCRANEPLFQFATHQRSGDAQFLGRLLQRRLSNNPACNPDRTFQRLDPNTAALHLPPRRGTLVGLNPLGVLRLTARALTIR